MDRNALIAAAVLGIVSLMALAVDQPWRMELRRAVVVERDERAGAADDSRRKLARIQSNLERLAAGAPHSTTSSKVRPIAQAPRRATWATCAASAPGPAAAAARSAKRTAFAA